MIRAAIVGLGRMGVSHCAIANALPDVEVAAICEPSGFVTAAVEKHAGLACYKDYRKMLDTVPLDCVFITTPTRFHFAMVHEALAAGLHVFVEKPFCLTADDGRQLVELAERQQVVNQVGYHNRFIGTFREARRLLAESAIGDVYHVLGEAYGPVVLKEKGMTWRSESGEGGGCLYDYATHVINLIQFLAGSPRSVSGAVLRRIYSKNVDDAVYATLHFPDGASGQLAVNWSDETYRKMSTRITVLGKKGKIVVDAQELRVHFREEPPDDAYVRGWNSRWLTELSPPVQFYLRGEEYSAQIEYFIDRIRTRRLDNVNSFASAQATDQVAHLIKQDAQTRQVT
jgi:predicted dehydrogenase